MLFTQQLHARKPNLSHLVVPAMRVAPPPRRPGAGARQTRADEQQAQVAGDLHGSKPTRVKASELHSSTLPQALGMLVRKL